MIFPKCIPIYTFCNIFLCIYCVVSSCKLSLRARQCLWTLPFPGAQNARLRARPSPLLRVSWAAGVLQGVAGCCRVLQGVAGC